MLGINNVSGGLFSNHEILPEIHAAKQIIMQENRVFVI
jgi:hypothetical protein